MMLDRLYKEVQAILNKAQMGYLPPHRFNLYVNGAVEIVYNWLIEEVRRSNRRMNWGLHGKDLADYTQYKEELLEWYTSTYGVTTTILNQGKAAAEEDNTGLISSEGEAVITLPSDYRFFLDMFRESDALPVQKVTYKEFNLMKRNNYVPVDDCNLLVTRRGTYLLFMPLDWTSVEDDRLILTYLRNPKNSIWAYQEFDGKPVYNPVSSIELDAPEALYDELLNIVLEKAGLSIRDRDIVNASNTEQQQQAQSENND